MYRLTLAPEGRDAVIRYFKPLAVPGVRIDQFDDVNVSGGEALRLWHGILTAMDATLQRLFGRGR
jgi:hypothetical protein